MRTFHSGMIGLGSGFMAGTIGGAIGMSLYDRIFLSAGLALILVACLSAVCEAIKSRRT